MEEKIKLANELISILERIENLDERSTMPADLVANARYAILAGLRVIFPAPPPS